MGLSSLLFYCKNLKILGRPRKMSKFPNLFIFYYPVLFSLVFLNIDGHMVGHNSHHRTEVIDSQGKYEVEWAVDFETKRITFNVTVLTKGYVGFGLSRNGTMEGADIIIGGVTNNGRSYFSDRYSVGNKLPEIDTTQHWTLNEAWEDETHTFLSFSRALDTCDPEDYPITGDKVSLIWAYGDSDTEIAYHQSQRGSYDVYLLDPDFSPKILRDSFQGIPKVIGRENLELKLWSVAQKIHIPPNDTSYICTLHKGPRLQQTHHLLGFDVQLNSVESHNYLKNVHIYKCNAPLGTSARSFFEPHSEEGKSQSCLVLQNPEGEIPTDYCTEILMEGWIPGGKTYFTPNDIGYPIGSSQDEYYLVQTVYHNPEQRGNVVVEFEIELYYTSLLRQHEAGILQVGHEIPGITPSLLIPPKSHGQIFGHCGAECTKLMFRHQDSGIKIFAVSLHARSFGRKLKLQHFRNSRELPWVAGDDNFSFKHQPIRNLREHIRVLPGDHLIMKCEYDNTWTNGTVVGGSLYHQEICIANIHYYNKIHDFSSCTSEIISEDYRKRFLGITNVTWDLLEQEFVVDAPGHHAGLPVSQVSNNHVLWEPEMRAEFERFHRYHPQINKCFRELYAKSDNASSARLVRSSTKDDDYFSGSTTYPVAKEFQPDRSCSLGLF